MSIEDRLKQFDTAAKQHGIKVGLHTARPLSLASAMRSKIALAALTAAAFYVAMPTQIDQVQETSSARAVSGIVQTEEALAAQHEDEIRKKLSFVEVTYKGRQTLTLSNESRIALAKEAAKAENLETVGLNWQDLYGVIHAETAWIARDGKGKNGVISRGLGQFENSTAKAINLKDPDDPVAAVRGTARLMREAGSWAHAKVAAAKVSAKLRGAALRAGVSAYYNLSSKGRAAWVPTKEHELPVETQAHIRNSADGTAIARKLETSLREQASLSAKVSFATGDDNAQKSTTEYPNPTQQEINFAIKVLKQLAPDPCVLPDDGKDPTIDQYSQCFKHKANAARANPNLKSFKSEVIGSFNGVPVAFTDFKEPNAFAVVFNPGTPTQFEAIGFTASLVTAISKLDSNLKNELALFVLDHELGHIHNNYQQADTEEEDLRKESISDKYALEMAMSRGMSTSTAQELVHDFAKLLAAINTGNRVESHITEARIKNLQGELDNRIERRKMADLPKF